MEKTNGTIDTTGTGQEIAERIAARGRERGLDMAIGGPDQDEPEEIRKVWARNKPGHPLKVAGSDAAWWCDPGIEGTVYGKGDQHDANQRIETWEEAWAHLDRYQPEGWHHSARAEKEALIATT